MRPALLLWPALVLALHGCAPVVELEDPATAPVMARSAGTYRNPVWPRDFPDPFVLQHAGRFYAFATQTGRPGIQALESPDLVHWTHRGVVFTTARASGDYWAPAVIDRAGQFYLFYSARARDSEWHDIGVARAGSPLGPYQDLATIVRARPGEGSLVDPEVFIDDDGVAYLLYSRERPRAILAQRLAPDWLSTDGAPVELLTPARRWEAGVVEAPTLIKRAGRYHLFYSAGQFQGRPRDPMYAVGHASADSVLGPYSRSRRPVIASRQGRVYGPGHQCIITLPSAAGPQDWLIYHAWDATGLPRYGSNRLGRTLRMDPILWDHGQPRVDGPSTDERPAPLPARAAALP